jgi:hypothetical protein
MSRLQNSYIRDGALHTFAVIEPGSMATTLTVMDLADDHVERLIAIASHAAWMAQAGRLYVAVYSHLARPNHDDPLTVPCELLGRCIADIYGTTWARKLFTRAAEAGWHEGVVFELLTALHYGEVQS